MVLHLAYSVFVYVALWREWVSPRRVATPTMWIDVLFGAAIGTLTEGVTSPAYPFFAFAVVAAGLRAGLRQAMRVTAASVGLYECLILISTRGGAEVYIMRPVYLAITGYLVGYLGQQHLELQDEMRQLEVTEQRHRIARDLHDNFAQALAGINLRLEGCRRQLRANPAAEMLTELTELQESVKREFDDLRTLHALAGRIGGDADRGTQPTPRRGSRVTRRVVRIGRSGRSRPADCARGDQQRAPSRPCQDRHDRDPHASASPGARQHRGRRGRIPERRRRRGPSPPGSRRSAAACRSWPTRGAGRIC